MRKELKDLLLEVGKTMYHHALSEGYEKDDNEYGDNVIDALQYLFDISATLNGLDRDEVEYIAKEIMLND